MASTTGPFTVVSFHAHPDDEVLYTGGTLARAAAEGHRVVLVVATDGAAGLASLLRYPPERLAAERRAELERSAAALGCANVVCLGYPDSGLGRPVPGAVFSRLPVPEAAAPLVELLRRERADVLTVYDPAGGYGHPDHRQVHAVGSHAAREAGTPVVLEATVDRSRILPAIRLVAGIPRLLPEVRPENFRTAYSAPEDITHRVDVRRFLGAKRAALRAHRSQGTSDGGVRTLTLLSSLPPPLARWVLGTEWFVEQGRPGGHPVDDIFASLR